jgi:hypothetical protein
MNRNRATPPAPAWTAAATTRDTSAVESPDASESAVYLSPEPIRHLAMRAPSASSRSRSRDRWRAALVPTACLLCVVAPPPARWTAAGPAITAGRAAGDDSNSTAVAFRALTHSARERLARDAGRLWSARLDTIPWMGVAGERVYLTDDPRAEGYQRYTAGVTDLWTGPVPPGVAPANTSVTWAGRRWAMVLLPLPADTAAAVRLLIHEASHAAQPAALPLPSYGEAGAGAELLDRPEGRIWLRMEWRALAAALERQGAARRRAAEDALLFRSARYAAAAPSERERERALDLVEGLPEYTAWTLTGGRPGELARLLRTATPPSSSYVRTFPYFTGPAYGMLLDQLGGPGWRAGLGPASDLQLLLLALLEGPGPELGAALRGRAADSADPAVVRRRAEAAGAGYGLATVRREEDARWVTREHELAALRARFVTGATLRLRPSALRISFDPGAQASLGDAGTVMRGLVWKGNDGAELQAPGGALVPPDWSELRVPLDSAVFSPGPLAAPGEWKTAGWTLTLPAGWVIAPDGASWVVTPRRTPK